MTRPNIDLRTLEMILCGSAVARLFADIVPGPDNLAAVAHRVRAAWYGAWRGSGLNSEAWQAWLRAMDDDRIHAWLTDVPGGVPPAAIRAWLVGAGRAEPEGATWLPVPPDERRGWPAILLPLWAGGPAAQCVELLALDPDDASRWAWRTAFAPVLAAGGLVEFDLAPWREAGENDKSPGRIRLRRHPLDWLRAQPAAHSYCVLDWAAGEARELLRLIDEGRLAAVCDDDAHAAEIRARARPRRPKIIVEVVREDEPSAGMAPGNAIAEGKPSGGATGPAPAGSSHASGGAE